MDIKPVQLYYEEIGQGIPVVLVHGFPLDHTIWGPVAEGLKAEARVILPDLRGHGKSPHTEDVYTMRLLAEDLHALIERLGLEKVILVGHSMGGYAALAFANAYPATLSALGLVATQADPDSPEKRQGRLVSARETKRRGAGFIAHGMAAKLTNDPEIQKSMMDLMLTNRPGSLINSLNGMAERSDANLWLPSIKVPAVVIAGVKDSIVSLERARTMAQMLSKGWLVEVPEAGHMPMLEKPQAVIDALKQLICHVRGCP